MKLALIDYSHIFWTTYHANAAGPYEATFNGTIERIERYADGFDVAVVCCDMPPYWRKGVFPEYKAKREEPPAAALEVMRKVKERLTDLGFPVRGVATFEADDVIATLAAKAAGHGYETTIYSGDKDLLQLVGGPVRVFSTNPKGSIVGPDEVLAKFGVTPSQLGDYLAICGDTSDNIPGAPGIGKVGAAKLLREYGSIHDIYDKIDSVEPQGLREKMIEHETKVLLSRKLVALSFNVPIDFQEAIAKPERKLSEATGAAPPVEDDEDDDRFSDTAISPPPAKPAAATDSRPAGDVPAPAQAGGRDVAQEKPTEGKESARSDMPTASETTAAESSAAKPALSQDEKPKGTSAALVKPPTVPLVLDRSDPSWVLYLEPRNLTQLRWFADELLASRLYTKFATPQAIEVAILRGRSMGLDMMTSLDVIHVVSGKPTMAAMAIIGLCLARTEICEYFEPVGDDDGISATWVTKRKGRPERRHTYTIQDAELAGLLKPSKKSPDEIPNWVKRPKPMLRKQSGVELARAVYPDIVANLYDPQELGDDS